MASTSQTPNDQVSQPEEFDEPTPGHPLRRHCCRYDPGNACCNAPCPPGALCNTEACSRRTEFYVQRWRCVWTRTPLDCGSKCKPETAWTKAWTCSFDLISRAAVLKSMCCREPARCPVDCNECHCFVPQDAFFAKVWEIEYEQCPDHQLVEGDPGFLDECHPVDSEGNPAGDACCGLFEVLCPRWVKITCRSDIPPSDPFAVPLPYYERPSKPEGCRKPPALCAGVGCRVGTQANRSPDFWLAPVLPFS